MLKRLLEKVENKDIFMLLIFVFASGYRTYYWPNEKLIGTVLMAVCYILMIYFGDGVIRVYRGFKYIGWYLALAILCAFSKMWAIHDNSVYISAMFKDVLVPLIIVILAVECYMNNYKSTTRLFNCIIVAEFVVCIRGLIHTPIVEVILTQDTRLFAANLGINYNDITTQMALVFIISVYLTFFYSRKYIHWDIIFFAFLMISGSRKAILISVIGAVLFYVISIGTDAILLFKRVFIVVVVGGILIFITFKNPFMYEMIGQKIEKVFETFGQSSSEMQVTDIDTSLHGRAVLREMAAEQFKANPLLGIGYYCFQYTNPYGLYAHNNYFELLSGLGLVGFVMYYIMYATILLNVLLAFLRRRRIKSKEYILVFGFVVLLVIMEYAQVTYMRLFALVPLITVAMAMEKGRDFEKCLDTQESTKNGTQ